MRLDDALIVKTEKLKTITFSLGTGNYSIIILAIVRNKHDDDIDTG